MELYDKLILMQKGFTSTHDVFLTGLSMNSLNTALYAWILQVHFKISLLLNVTCCPVLMCNQAEFGIKNELGQEWEGKHVAQCAGIP